MDLTFDDVFILPGYSEVKSRLDVDLTPVDSRGETIPIVVANMPPVAGKRMAETIARRGGITILPQYLPAEKIGKTFGHLRACNPLIETATTLSPDSRVRDALSLIPKRAHGVAYIVGERSELLGVFTPKDAKNHDLYTPIGTVMKTDVVSGLLCEPFMTYFQRMETEHLDVLPVVDAFGALRGVVTKGGLVRSTLYKPALNADGLLMTCASVGIRDTSSGYADEIIKLGFDVIVVDAAHGHQARMLECLRALRGKTDAFLVAGNVVTREATRDLICAGANAVKVGVGPGATCTTRQMTGVGRPQFSAIKECAEEADALGGFVWADGGVKQPRDVALALAAGASRVVIGTLFAGTYESAADLQVDEQGRPYKELYGTSSNRAVDHYIAKGMPEIERLRRLYLDEGVGPSRAYLKPGLEGAEDVLDKLTAGLRSTFAYVGAHSMEQFRAKVRVDTQTPSGYTEGRPSVGTWTF